MAQTTSTATCPICKSPDFREFFSIDALPVSDGILYKNAESSRSAPKGAIALACCHVCGYIGNLRAEKFDLICGPEYEISLHHSPVYREFLEETCRSLIDRYNIKDSSVLEIGCGKGYFLELICRLGANTGYGFDPVVPNYSTIRLGGTSVYLSPEDYTNHCARIQPALICCRHVLQQILDPAAFVKNIYYQTKSRPTSVVYLEVPNARSIFRQENVWSILYEYHSYFSDSSLTKLFTNCGFDVLKSSPCYVGGQYIAIEASPSSETQKEIGHLAPPSDLLSQVMEFSKTYESKVESWKQRLVSLTSKGKKIVAWGSGGRAICFFNSVQVADDIPYVVDINPDRQGYYLPSTAQRIVAPEFLKEFRPDMIVVTNPTYENEIREMARGMGIDCETVSI